MKLLKIIDLRRGFTLPEILAVLLISSILALITLPSISIINNHIQLKKELIRLERFLQNLSLEASRRGIPVKFTIKKTGYEAETIESNPSYLGFRKLPQTLSIDLSNSKNTILFYGNGVNLPTTIRIIGPTSRCSISLSLRGRVNSRCK